MRRVINFFVQLFVQFFILMVGLALCTLAYSGSTETRAPNFPIKDIKRFSKEVERRAAEQGASVFIIARQGRPVSQLPKNVYFTHVALAVYSSISLPDGTDTRGYAIYNLYQDDEEKGRSQLVVDYPIDFFSGVHELKAGIIIPTPELQAALFDLIYADGLTALHNPNYSVMANPFTQERQNCTEFVLDNINAAIYQTSDRVEIKRKIEAYFEPQPIRINRLALGVGALFSDGLTLADHSGAIKTATFNTISEYMQLYGLTQQVIVMEDGVVGKTNGYCALSDGCRAKSAILLASD